MSWVNIAEVIYPVGSYYISNTSTTPATLFGGSWTQLTSRFLYATTSTSTGGSNTHTLTVDQIPSHMHNVISESNGEQVARHMTIGTRGTKGEASRSTSLNTEYIVTSYTGGGASHNNMPAYKGVYCWYRTA